MITLTSPSLKFHSLHKLSAEKFATLSSPAADGSTVVTLCVPMEKKGRETRKNHIIFKNALRKAQDLVAKRLPDSSLNDTLASLEALNAETHDLWQHQQHGLLMIVREEGEDSVEAFQLPYHVEKSVHLGETPYTVPLIKLVGQIDVPVLALDLEKTELLRAYPNHFERIDLGDTPTSLAFAMRYDDPEESLQQRSISSGAGAAFHGQGVTGDETEKKKIQRFFEMLDNGLTQPLRDFERPLVLLGPASETGLFRKVTQQKLSEHSIELNPSHLSDDELTEHLAETLENVAADERKVALERLGDAIGQGQGSDDAEEIVRAAATGKVAELFVQEDSELYGTISDDLSAANVRDTRQSGDRDMINYAATQTTQNSGEIYLVPEDEAAAPLAAIYRY